MKIVATQYTLKTKSLEIYLAGCKGNPKCKGCHNPELWNFDLGEFYNKDYYFKIVQKINDFDNMIDNIMIFGGEPNDQEYEILKNFLSDLRSLNKKIWLFTRYKFEDLPEFELELCDYIKCGEYIPDLTTNDNMQYGIKLATLNQMIYKKGLDY